MKIEIKECSRHGYVEFVKYEKAGFKCKKCSNEAITRHKRRIKLFCIKYRGNKCEVCGYNKCIDAFDFHHVGNKLFSIGKYGYRVNKEKLILELDKCMLLCSNCHREIHFEINGSSRYDGLQILDKNLIKKREKYFCIDCGKEVSNKKSKRCRSCFRVSIRKIKVRPPVFELIDDVKKYGYCAVGRKYKVSDTTVRQWIKDGM